MVSSQTGTGGAPDDLSDIKRKLVWRMGIAGLMIVGLLVGLAIFDHYSVEREAEPSATQYTQPVPVPRKLTTPLKPVEPPAEPASDVAKDQKTAAAPESSAAPAEKEAPPEKPAPEPAPPPPPMVTAQPVLPRASSPRGPVPAPASQSAPHAPGKSAEPKALTAATPVREEPVVATEQAPIKPQPAPPRLFSGYALQAGVFSDPRRAEELHAKLTLEGIPSTIEARVQVGPFKTRVEAEAARAKMKELGIDSVMLMPKGVKR